MSQLKFEHYTFNLASLALHANSESVELRPKTAELLRELITHRDTVMSKRDLIKRVWHTEHVTDQSLFQAVSELRAKLSSGAIKTFPNRGYQWVVPVVEVSNQRTRLGLAVAATLLVAVTGIASQWGALGFSQAQTPELALQQTGQHSPNRSGQAVTSLPALVAFSEGVSALQRGDTLHALELLELSVIERPDFTEARLLLAEAHLLHGNALDGRTVADNVMRSLDSEVNAYSLVAAMDLLSRADQQLGQMNSALEWATRAADKANSNGFECTAADLHDRVLELVEEHGADTYEASPVFASAFAQEMLDTALTDDTVDANFVDRRFVYSPVEGAGNQVAKEFGWLGDPKKLNRPAHCEQLRGGPTGGLIERPNAGLPHDNRIANHLVFPKPLI